ncbi:MAG: tRNA threonylcarbamoyladenosine dehydratase [Eubacteriales bacterium]
MMEEFALSRTELLLGREALERLKASSVAVFGVGGVGGYCVEALARCGIGRLAIVDGDRVAVSNLNRQIIATTDTIGISKVEAMKKRIHSISPDTIIETYPIFYNEENSGIISLDSFDYVVDAIDTVSSKITLIMKAKAANTEVISCMGAGNKLDPTQFEVADIYSTSVCPLAKVMRRELRKRGVESLRVVFSKEEPVKTGQRVPGSVSFVPSVAGLIIAGEVIRTLAGVLAL